MCRESPLYGGTGSLDLKRFDEPGYIAQPPCLWGAAEHGLEAPPAVGGRMMYAEAKTNSCLLYTSPSPRDKRQSRMPSSA